MGIFSRVFGVSGYQDISGCVCVQSVDLEDDAGSTSSVVFFGYQADWFRRFFRNFFCICLAGLPYLFLKWYPQVEASVFFKLCPIEFAPVILVKDACGKSSLHPVCESTADHDTCFRYFVYKLQRFVWCKESLQFIRLKGLADGVNTFNRIFSFGHEVEETAEQKRQRLRAIHGENMIRVEVKSYWQLLVDEILNPFYIFEGLSVVLWIFDEYVYYAIFIIFVSAVSICLSLSQTRKQLVILRSIACSFSKTTAVIVHSPHLGSFEESCEQLVPGDIIEIPSNGCVMMCDALLLSGTCIVNESSLTGESLPVTKVPPIYGDEIYMPNSLHMKHTLYCGTEVLQTRYYENDKVLAVVTETGSNTANGQLIRSILYPKSMAFDFMVESIKFIVLLFAVAFLAMAYSSYLYILRQASLETLLLRTLDLVTIVVPPTLPAAMTAGTYYSQKRLKKKGIFCISPTKIVICGETSLVCFDKTGTLTEEGMDVWGVLPALPNQSHKRCVELSDNNIVNDIRTMDDKSLIKSALASCHSLTVIGNEICGEPLDVTIFKATGWELEEPGEDTVKFDRLDPTIVRPKKKIINKTDGACSNIMDASLGQDNMELEHVPYEIGLIRQFPFTSSTQNMTVICRILGARNMIVFSKGAPEKIVCLCHPDTVPENLMSVLARFTMAGFRVIALASKEMPRSFTWAQSQRILRDQIEKDLHFIGLLLMQNNLKQQSQPVITQLKMANIKCIMATGDNVMTAINVSQQCGILPRADQFRQVVLVSVEMDSSNTTSTSTMCSLPPQIIVEPLFGMMEPTNTIDLNDDSVEIAMEGNTWSHLRMHYPLLFDAITVKTAVFARMSPQHKTLLIDTLQQLGHHVMMCGDGANDCGALKAATVGISLSRTEASIVAPFTSHSGSVECVIELIREGRCALVTSFGLFNYMAMYSLIQFFSVIILYNIGAEMGTMEFLYVDIVVTSSLVLSMGCSGPSDRLIVDRPSTSLLSVTNVAPLLLHILTVFLFQLIGLHLLRLQPWFKPVNPAVEDEEVVLCWENTVVYLISCFQYLAFALLYSRGRPHRQSVYKNWLMVELLALLFFFTMLLVLYPPNVLTDIFELQPWTSTDSYFRIVLVLLPSVQFLISFLIQLVFTGGGIESESGLLDNLAVTFKGNV